MRKLVIIILTFCVFIKCSSLKTVQSSSSECSVDLNDSYITSYTDPDTGYIFSTLKGFKIKRLKEQNCYLYIATSSDGMFQHSVKIISNDELNSLPNHQSNISIKKGESRRLYSSKLKQYYKFSNGTAYKKLNDSNQIKGLVALDYYDFKDRKISIIVTAIDFCSTESSNNIESYFSINREPLLN